MKDAWDPREIYRAEALRAYAVTETQTEELPTVPRWVNQLYWIIIVVFASAIVVLFTTRLPEQALGSAVVHADADGARQSIYVSFPRQYGARLQPGTPMHMIWRSGTEDELLVSDVHTGDNTTAVVVARADAPRGAGLTSGATGTAVLQVRSRLAFVLWPSLSTLVKDEYR
jgi:hypothetical protein